MLLAPDRRVLASVRRLAPLEDFQVLLNYLENSLKHRDEFNRECVDHHLYRSQGSSLTLVAILKLVEEANENLKIV